jgi:hypothetical protein
VHRSRLHLFQHPDETLRHNSTRQWLVRMKLVAS